MMDFRRVPGENKREQAILTSGHAYLIHFSSIAWASTGLL